MDNNPTPKSNAQIIRELYEESGMSYRKLSQITGVKYNTLVSWLTGRRNPPDYAVDVIIYKIQEAMSRRKKKPK